MVVDHQDPDRLLAGTAVVVPAGTVTAGVIGNVRIAHGPEGVRHRSSP